MSLNILWIIFLGLIPRSEITEPKVTESRLQNQTLSGS